MKAEKKSNSIKINKKQKAKRKTSSKEKLQSELNKIKNKPNTNNITVYNEKKYYRKINSKSKQFFLVFILLITICFLLTILSVLSLELTHSRNDNDLNQLAKDQYAEENTIKSERGNIYDTNGEPLTANLEVYDMYAILDPSYTCIIDNQEQNCSVENPEETGKELALILGYDDPEVQEYFIDKLSQDLYQVSFGEYGQDLTLSQKQSIEDSGMKGIYFEEKNLRYYTYGDFASYVVGYATTDENNQVNGEMGIEKQLDGYLKGQDGIEKKYEDIYGIELTDEQSSVLPKLDGIDVKLTLDSTIQSYVQSEMDKALSQIDGYESELTFTVVMDANDGSILAAQSYPSFDPNEKEIEMYTNPYTDYCFEPGSTFKTMTVSAAKELGYWNEETVVPTGVRTNEDWDDFEIGDWNERNGWGNLTWRQGYYMSSNVAMTYVKDAIPNDEWDKYVSETMLFGEPVETEFYQTSSCTYNPTYPVEYANTSFGQGLTVNAMQMLRAYSSFADDGMMKTPHVIEELVDPETNKTIYSEESLDQKQAVSLETADFVQGMMKGAVYYEDENIRGTGYQYGDGKYEVGTKTGTAQVTDANGEYNNSQYIYSTMNMAPIDDPEIIVYTVAVRPNSSLVSTQSMPDYINPIIDQTLDYLHKENYQEEYNVDKENQQMQNYIGLNQSEAYNQITDSSLDYKIIGDGDIVMQYPKEGQKITENDQIILVAEENYSSDDFIGLKSYEANFVCNELKKDCQFQESGSQVIAIKEDQEKYLITLG